MIKLSPLCTKKEPTGLFGLISFVVIISIFIIIINLIIINIIHENSYEPAELIRAVRNSVGQSRSFSRAGNAVEIEMRN